MLGSDSPRTFSQALARIAARGIVSALGLNRSGSFPTEIVQAIAPVARIHTDMGALLCRTGHGRLTWRARTFHTEEPDTIAWLQTMPSDSVLWDIGANVGLYSLYAAKRGLGVVAFEPEAQNYALLLENIVLNGLQARITASNLALASKSGLGHLACRYITKGGAYNLFTTHGSTQRTPASIQAAQPSKDAYEQLTYGATVDHLAAHGALPHPNYLKLDVDGLEPRILEGAVHTLRNARLRSVLVELNSDSREDMEVPALMRAFGFTRITLGTGRSTRKATAMQNYIFTRTTT